MKKGIPSRLLGLAVVAGLLWVAPAGSAAPGCAGLLRTQTGVTGEWRVFAQPEFPAGPQEVRAHATDRQRWVVTNGTSVLSSPDAGCTWRELVTLPVNPTAEVPARRADDRITGLAAAGGRVIATVHLLSESVQGLPITVESDGESSLPQGSTLVLRGTSALTAGGPLPAGGDRPGPAVIAPSTGTTAYVAVGAQLNRSTDGGSTWRAVTPPTTVLRDGEESSTVDVLPPRLTALAVDPTDAQEVWAHVTGGVYGTSDGGTSWRRGVETAFGARFPAIAVGGVRGGAPRVTAVETPADSGGIAALRVSDGGAFRRLQTGPRGLGTVVGAAQSAAAGRDPSELVVTTLGASRGASQAYYLLAQQERLVAADQFGLGPLLDVQRAGSAFAFRTDTTLVRWVPDPSGLQGFVPPPPPPATDIGVGEIGPGLPPLSAQTVLSTTKRALTLPPAGSDRLPLRLDLSPEPTPLDVFFLVDTSGSMGDVVDGIADAFADVARKLGRRGIDVQYGLGEYQDTNGVRYRRLLDISPPGEPLRQALEGIQTAGGAEPAYTALRQMVTGSGIEDPPSGAAVQPDQDATWRDGSLRIVIHATDEVPTVEDDYATEDEAIDALKADGVRHIGLHVVRDEVASATGGEVVTIDPVELQGALERLSEETGGLAPPGGMDCDDDGEAEVRQGEPLVCRFLPGLLKSRIELSRPLLKLLGQIVDLQPVDVAVEPAEAAGLFDARLVARPAEDKVDVKLPARLDYVLQVTCTPAAYGETRDLVLRPRVGKRVGNPLPVRVACDPLPGAPRVPQELAYVAPVAPVVLLPALPPPPPPPPAPAAAPAPAPAPAPGGVTAPVPGVAVAPDEGQVELAYVHQEAERAGEQLELAMVAADQRPDLLALRMLGLTLVTGAAGAVAMRRREAVQVRRSA